MSYFSIPPSYNSNCYSPEIQNNPFNQEPTTPQNDDSKFTKVFSTAQENRNKSPSSEENLFPPFYDYFFEPSPVSQQVEDIYDLSLLCFQNLNDSTLFPPLPFENEAEFCFKNLEEDKIENQEISPPHLDLNIVVKVAPEPHSEVNSQTSRKAMKQKNINRPNPYFKKRKKRNSEFSENVKKAVLKGVNKAEKSPEYIFSFKGFSFEILNIFQHLNCPKIANFFPVLMKRRPFFIHLRFDNNKGIDLNLLDSLTSNFKLHVKYENDSLDQDVRIVNFKKKHVICKNHCITRFTIPQSAIFKKEVGDFYFKDKAFLKNFIIINTEYEKDSFFEIPRFQKHIINLPEGSYNKDPSSEVVRLSGGTCLKLFHESLADIFKP